MVANPFEPHPYQLIGRQTELHTIQTILQADGDLLMTGVPGSGRQTLIHLAAQKIGAKVITIDCLRATNQARFLQLLSDGLLAVLTTPEEISLIQRWSLNQPVTLEKLPAGRFRLRWHLGPQQGWTELQSFLALPQQLAERFSYRFVIVLENFPHIRSWDRSQQWETYLRQEIQQQSHVSYAILTTVAENWATQPNFHIMSLEPLSDQILGEWIQSAMAAEGLKFEPSGAALQFFLDSVQGHLGDAIAIARRIWLDCRALEPDWNQEHAGLYIQAHQVHRSIHSLIEDLAPTFESLILLLPPSQIRVLESLAIDPTDSPHSRDYTQKHQLSRGGGLQGALASLEQKGLLYGPQQGYRIALPLFALWLRQRLA
ncbi:MAG: ATP-binding protein [Thainema sp.]